ncbi:MAG: hypothetical protein KDE46_27440, partial [Caldilineaceae bacterium]|nr:hypothetical protein [Caldilineaceae bacterium]
SFPLAAQLGPGVQLEVNGKTADGGWYRVCCFDMGAQTGDNTLWVRNEPSVIRVFNEPALNVWATPVLSPPTPISVYFSRAQGPEVLGIDNDFLTIYVKVVGDPPGYTRALPGYFLAVEFKPVGQNAFSKREASNRGPDNVLLTSTDYFSSDLGGIQYNYKFEYMPNGDSLDGDWRFWLTNAQGEQMSELVTFTSKPRERGVYVVWHQVR